MALPWSEPPSGGWLCPTLRRPPDLLELPASQAIAEPPSSQPDPLFRALDESILANGPAVLTPSSRMEWLYALARTLATARNGLRTVMAKHADEAFDSLTDQEIDYVGTFAVCAHAVHSFAGALHSDPDELLFCGACLTHSGISVTEHDWISVLHQCGRDVSAARDTLIAQHTSSITDEIRDWDAFQRHSLKEAIITSITSLSPPSHFTDLGVDPRLEDWFKQARSSLLANADIRAQADADAHRDILYADLCAKAESEAKTMAQSHYDTTLARLRNEAELAALDTIKSSAPAPPLGKSSSTSGRASRKAKASPVVSRPPSRATIHSPIPLPLPTNIPKATTLGMGLDPASPIIPPSLPTSSVPMVTDDTTPTGSPVVRPALVERYVLRSWP